MAKKDEQGIVLSQEEADFIKELIFRNRKQIIHTVSVVVKKGFSHLFEECIAETYLVACVNAKTLMNHPNPDGWIVKAAKITSMRLIEQPYNHRVFPSGDLPTVAFSGDVFEDAVYNIWIENDIPRKLIDSLTKREKEVYNLLYIEKKKTDEVAETLGISQYTVWVIDHSIRKKIKNKIKKELL